MKQLSFRDKQNITMYSFTVPAVILFTLFVIVPFTRGIFLAFTNWNGYSKTYRMVGFSNFIRLFTDQNVRRALFNTLVYGIGSTLIQNIVGLSIALLLNQKFKGRDTARTIIYLPVMIAPLLMGFIMYFFFTLDGAINQLPWNIGKEGIDWLASGARGVAIMTLINSWQFVGISMVIYLAGLQGISSMYYEAANLDGVKGWGLFRYITFPLLAPALNSAIIINLIGGLKLFDVIMALTKGGPGYDSNSLSTLVNRTYFGSENAGFASAIGLVTFLLIMVLSFITTNALNNYQESMS